MVMVMLVLPSGMASHMTDSHPGATFQRESFFMMVYLDNDNEDGCNGCQESFVIVWCLLIKIDTISLPAYLVEVLSSQEVQKENFSSLTLLVRSVPSSLGNPKQREWLTSDLLTRLVFVRVDVD